MLTALLAALVLVAFLARCDAAGAATYVLSPSGDDRAPGTAAAPWLTFARAERTVRPGDVVCLMPGTYGSRGTRTTLKAVGTASAPIAWRACSAGDPPAFLGQLRLSAPYNEVSGMRFLGPTGPIEGREDIPVWLNAPGTRVSHSEVSGSLWHAGVFVSEAPGFSIDHDYIHDNGVHYNLDHGIYISVEAPGTIEDNLIADNYAWGINLYPDAYEVTINHNTIVGNGRGGVIVSNESRGNLLTNNLVVGNHEFGIRGYDLSADAHNVVRRNLLWDQGEELLGDGVEFSENLVADPRIISLGNPRLLPGSPAIGAAIGSTGEADLAGTPWTVPADIGALQHLAPRVTAVYALATLAGEYLGRAARDLGVVSSPEPEGE